MHTRYFRRFLILLFAIWLIASILAVFLFFGSMPGEAKAKDFGVQGHTQIIKEQDLLEMMMSKMHEFQKNGRIHTLQEDLKNKTLKRIKSPSPVLGLKKALKNRTFTYDPSIRVPFDIKDHTGTLIHKAGKKVNPLDHMGFRQTWLFVEGKDKRQIEWALKERQGIQKKIKKNQRAKIILINGSPFDLSEKYHHRFYFDQLGKLTEQFGIKRVPSMLYQCGSLICIEEIPVGETLEKLEREKKNPTEILNKNKMLILKNEDSSKKESLG